MAPLPPRAAPGKRREERIMKNPTYTRRGLAACRREAKRLYPAAKTLAAKRANLAQERQFLIEIARLVNRGDVAAISPRFARRKSVAGGARFLCVHTRTKSGCVACDNDRFGDGEFQEIFTVEEVKEALLANRRAMEVLTERFAEEEPLCEVCW